MLFLDFHIFLRYFWKRWISEYLTELREHQRCQSHDYSTVIKVGDVAIVYDEKKPRTLWTVAVVEKLNPSSDGNVRGALIRYIVNGQTIKISRPINKLYIEFKTDEDFIVDVC